AADNGGDFAIAWQSDGQDAASSWGVYAQLYNAAGTPQGGEFRVNTTTDGDQTLPQVAADANGDLVFVWASGGQEGSGLGVFAQCYNASGVPQGGEFRVNTTTAGDQTSPAVVADNRGGFVVAWQSYGQDAAGSWGVYAQQFSRKGNPVAGEFAVNGT